MHGPGQRGEGAVEGKHARSVFVGWRFKSSVLNPAKKLILSFFGAGREGSLVGGDRGGSWGGGGREVEGSAGGVVGVMAEGIGVGSAGHAGARAEGGGWTSGLGGVGGRGRASAHGAFSCVTNRRF